MDESFTFRFTPLERDYICTYRTFSLRLNSTKIILMITGVLFLCDLFYLLFSRLQFNIIVIFTILMFPMFIFRVFFPLGLYNQLKSNERLLAEVTWNISEVGITTGTKFVETKLDWGSFKEYFDTPNYFFLIYSTNKNCFLFIPKRIFGSFTGQQQYFRNILDNHVKMGKQVEHELSWTPSIKLVNAIGIIFVLTFVGFICLYQIISR